MVEKVVNFLVNLSFLCFLSLLKILLCFFLFTLSSRLSILTFIIHFLRLYILSSVHTFLIFFSPVYKVSSLFCFSYLDFHHSLLCFFNYLRFISTNIPLAIYLSSPSLSTPPGLFLFFYRYFVHIFLFLFSVFLFSCLHVLTLPFVLPIIRIQMFRVYSTLISFH